jgi:DNA-binding SARP family transcriptional activator
VVKGPWLDSPYAGASSNATAMLSLLGGFELRSGGGPIEVPHSARRLLAFLALQERPVSRSFVAGTLWPETTDERAGASLRSTLWRISQLCEAVATWPNQRLALSAEVVVDLDQATGKARLLLARSHAHPRPAR